MFYNDEIYKNVRDLIKWKKSEAHKMDWLYIEVDDIGIIRELKLSTEQISTVRLAMTNCLLEGDSIIQDNDAHYILRYNVDDLARRKMVD